jgi:acylphosphatase
VSARRWRIRGVVQGVGYRAFALRAARATGVGGGVRNEADGSVTAVATGESAALDRFGAELARGPRHAEVTRVESEELASPAAAERFDLEF